MFLKGALAVILSLAMALAWQTFAVQGLEKALIVAVVAQEAAETTVRTLKISGELIDTQLKQFASKVVVIEKERNDARQQVNRMRDLFQDHNFAKLLSRKPGLVENLMIKKTQEVFDEIETLTAP